MSSHPSVTSLSHSTSSPEQSIDKQEINHHTPDPGLIKGISYYNSLSLEELVSQRDALNSRCQFLDNIVAQEFPKLKLTPSEKKMLNSVIRDHK